MIEHNPILNNPYQEPKLHYATDQQEGTINYNDIRKGRRIFVPDTPTIPVKHGPQANLYEVNDFEHTYRKELINLIRKEVEQWRESEYSNTTRITKELLTGSTIPNGWLPKDYFSRNVKP